MTPPRSSQNFVRTLKATSDPPTLNGPTKIEIARQAWDDSSFYVPGKPDLIVDWILTSMLKGKAKERSQNAISDVRYWSLLYDVLCAETAPKTAYSRPFKSWLTPILHRIAIGPIITSLLNVMADLPIEERAHFSSIVFPSFAILWPICSQKMSTEQLLECWGLSMNLTTLFVNPDVVKIGQLITKSYRHSFSTFVNKKKLYAVFLQSYLQRWLQSISAHPPPVDQYGALLHDTLETGYDVIFSVDVLRYEHESRTELSLFAALERLSVQCMETVLAALPQLFSSFIRTLRRYREAVFSQSSNKTTGSIMDELNSAGMKFFISCLNIASHSEEEKWVSTMKLLSVVEQENLFHRQQVESGIAFTNVIENIISTLSRASKVHGLDVSTAAIQCLTVIARIDYDIIVPIVGRVLPHLLLIPEPKAEHLIFLEVLIDYHSKTRTINIYIDNLFAVSASQHILASSDPKELYKTLFSGSLMHADHLKQLSKAVQKFVTASQCIPVVSAVLERVEAYLEVYQATEEYSRIRNVEGLRKRRKKEVSVDFSQDPDAIAISFSLLAKLSTTIISSIPSANLPPEPMQVLQEKVIAFRGNLNRFLMKYTKAIKEISGSDIWSNQIVLAAVLRFRYSLTVSCTLRLPKHHDISLSQDLYKTFDNDDIIPELTIEIFRQLFQECSLENTVNAQVTIDVALNFIENNFRTTGVYWSGQSHALTSGNEGKSRASLSLLHMILERWISVVEHVASSAQLERLVKIVVSIRPLSSEPKTTLLGAPALIQRALHSAEFWELNRLRAAFLSYVTTTTAIVDNNDSRKVFFVDVSDAVAAYRLLLFFPPEYLTRGSRADLVRHALFADSQVRSKKLGQDRPSSFISEALYILRMFIKRLFIYNGAIELSNRHIAEFMEHVCEEEDGVHESEPYVQVTLDLSELYLHELLKAAQTNQSNDLSKLLLSLSQQDLHSISSTRFGIFTRLIRLLAMFSARTFKEDIIPALKVLYDKMFRFLYPGLNTSFLNNACFTSMDDCSRLLSSWAHLVKFGIWLEVEGIPLLGQRAVTMLISSFSPANLNSARVAAFSIVLEEVKYLKHDVNRLDIMVASYVAFAVTLNKEGLEGLDACLFQTTQTLSPEDFGHILRLTGESLHSNTVESHSQHLVHLATSLLHSHPQGSLRHIQLFATQCLDAFVGNSCFTTGPIPLRLEVLNFVKQHCTERPSTLNTMDIGGIWALFSKLLSPSEEHDDVTNAEIFHKITATIGSLIRLRRDLLIPTLPHLSLILRQLMLATRCCRLQLGSKQLKMVSDTLPRWINPTQGLGGDEGKALSRVFEALTTKTLIRSHKAPEIQKAESLSKPFSKHAAYVLKAYIDSMSDALCVVPSELRKELQPGLFALCDMINDHSRDAMMVSGLDSGGKMTMKTLWKEYDMQRYVGKG